MAESKQFNIVRRIKTRQGDRVMWLPVGTFTLNENGRGVATLNAAEGEFFIFPSRNNSKGEYDQSPPEPRDRDAMERGDHGGAPEFGTQRKDGYKFDPNF